VLFLALLLPPRTGERKMQGWHRFSRIAALSLCIVLAASLAEFPGQEPFGLHLDSDGKRIPLSGSDIGPVHIQLTESDPVMVSDPLDEEPCIATTAMLSRLLLCRSGSGPVVTGSRPPYDAGPGSSSVLRI